MVVLGKEMKLGSNIMSWNRLLSPLGEPGHPTMKWSFPPVPSSSPSLGLSDEQSKPISSWTIVECDFGFDKCRKVFKAGQVVVSQVRAGGVVREGVHKEEEVRLGLLVRREVRKKAFKTEVHQGKMPCVLVIARVVS